MESKDYYRIMGLARNATPDEIKYAYRHLAHKYHPDVSEDAQAEVHFKEIGEAYEVLRDPQKRARYDRLHPSWRTAPDARPSSPGRHSQATHHGARLDPHAAGDFVDFSDFLSRRSHNGTPPNDGGAVHMQGADRHARVPIDLEDAYHGATRSVRLHMPEVDAHGHAALHERQIVFMIPRGIVAGQQIRLASQGAPAAGPGRAGDLYLEVQFRPHARYRVDRRDVCLDLPLTPWEAALGAEVRVPTPSGWVDLTIPPGSPSGSRLRLKGRGIPAAVPGDFYFVLQITQPRADSPSSRAFYRDMAERFKSFDPRPGLRGSA